MKRLLLRLFAVAVVAAAAAAVTSERRAYDRYRTTLDEGERLQIDLDEQLARTNFEQQVRIQAHHQALAKQKAEALGLREAMARPTPVRPSARS